MDTNANLKKMAEIQNIQLLNEYDNEFSPIKFKCNRCESENEDYPLMLLEYENWCPNCKSDPHQVLLGMFSQLNIKVLDTKIRNNLFDYKVERDNKKALIKIKNSDDDNTVKDACEMANKANLKLLIIPKYLIFSTKPELLSFIEASINSSDKILTFTETIKEQDFSDIVKPLDETELLTKPNEQLTEEDLVTKLLLEAGFKRENLIQIGIDSQSFVSKPIPAPKDAKIAYGYCRVSTVMQLEGHSIASQVHSMQSYCLYEKMHLSSIFFDLAISGRHNNRPALKELMSRLKKGNTLVVVALARLARNLKNSLDLLEEIQNKGANLSLLDLKINTDSALGKMLFSIVSSFAEFEARQTSERISTVMNNMKENGTLKSRPPYGWAFVDKKSPWIKVEKEQRMIEYIRNIRKNQPDMTVSQICRHLNKLKDPCLRKGTKRWYDSSLIFLLKKNEIPLPSIEDAAASSSVSESVQVSDEEEHGDIDE